MRRWCPGCGEVLVGPPDVLIYLPSSCCHHWYRISNAALTYPLIRKFSNNVRKYIAKADTLCLQSRDQHRLIYSPTPNYVAFLWVLTSESCSRISMMQGLNMTVIRRDSSLPDADKGRNSCNIGPTQLLCVRESSNQCYWESIKRMYMHRLFNILFVFINIKAGHVWVFTVRILSASDSKCHWWKASHKRLSATSSDFTRVVSLIGSFKYRFAKPQVGDSFALLSVRLHF